ncbi:MAG: hypothetical protein KDA84_20150 [Planctomycetaceae bacterium]|nr:hypothetical protein [Planctomycetaceae bacterium]
MMVPASPQTVYTASVVLWLLLVQRLDKGCSSRDAVDRLLKSKPDLLPDNKRASEEALSARNYSGW